MTVLTRHRRATECNDIGMRATGKPRLCLLQTYLTPDAKRRIARLAARRNASISSLTEMWVMAGLEAAESEAVE